MPKNVIDRFRGFRIWVVPDEIVKTRSSEKHLVALQHRRRRLLLGAEEVVGERVEGPHLVRRVRG